MKVKTNIESDRQPMHQRNAGKDRERSTITGRSCIGIISQLTGRNQSLRGDRKCDYYWWPNRVLLRHIRHQLGTINFLRTE